MSINSVEEFITKDSWLVTPIVAAIGWCQTWLIAAFLKKAAAVNEAVEQSRQYIKDHEKDPGPAVTETSGEVANRRYTGIAKRTVIAAKLADSYTATPEKIVGVLSLDPAFSTQLLDLDHPVCDAGLLDYVAFIFQFAATIYGIVTTSIVWTHNAQLETATYHIQMQQLLAVLTYNRGTWSIAALGAFSPWAPLKVLYLTSAIAVAAEVTFLVRGFLIGWQMSLTPDIYRTFTVLPWVLPAAEAIAMACGVLAMTYNLRYISPSTIIFVLPAIWLALGPLLIIGVALATHFGLFDCIVYQNNVCGSS